MSVLELTPSTFPVALSSNLPASGKVTVTAPFDGADITQIETVDAAHIEEALNIATQLYRQRKDWLNVPTRVEILERTAELMQAYADELALEAAREGGKPLLDSQIEVARAIDGVKQCAEHIRVHGGYVVPVATTPAGLGKMAFTQTEPIGVVVAVSAFNHPLNLIVHQVGAAIAAGCPVIVKPADDTPLSCLRFQRILHAAGLPPEWLQVAITDSLNVAEQLVTDSRVAFFSFIGSARVGWMLRSKLAPGTRCALEHGGAAPLIIGRHGSLERALPAVVKGGFYHAGQVCVSVQRVFVPHDKASDFARQLATAAQALVVGDPTAVETQVGPLIRHAEVTRGCWLGG